MIIKNTEIIDEDLNSLFNNEVLGIHINNYVSDDICSKLVKFVDTKKNSIEKYDHDEKVGNSIVTQYYGIERLGYPYNKTFGKTSESEEFHNYYKYAKTFMKEVRSSMNPHTSPIDKVRLDLDESWSHGANIANIEGKKMYAGIIRVSDMSLSHLSEEHPHIDYLVSDKVSYDGQFSAIVYVSTPEKGGELEIWDSNEKSNFDKKWISSQSKSYIIKPSKGDLLIINTNKPHAIKSFTNGKRIAIQCFIGLNKNKSLSLWS